MAYETSGSLTTDERETSDEVSWYTQTEWEAYQSATNVDITDGVVQLASTIPDSGVSRWTFDAADTESGTALDSWGNNDGTINGATTGVSGANETYTTDEAYSFDGADDYVDFGAFGDGLEAFSVAAWVNPDSLVGDMPILMRDGGLARNDRHWSLRIDDSNGTVSMWAQDGSDNKIQATTSSTISTGSWSHIVGTIGGTTATIYVNGTSDGSDSNSSYGVQPSSSETVKAGGDDVGGYEFYEGDIDDPRFYDKELSSTEVSNLYNNGSI